jgi:hypothetical protein
MMLLDVLLEVQLVLLHTLVDGVHLLLHRGDGLLHGAHSTLNGSYGLHYLRIIYFRLRRREGLRGGSHIRKANKHGSKYIIIRQGGNAVTSLYIGLVGSSSGQCINAVRMSAELETSR